MISEDGLSQKLTKTFLLFLFFALQRTSDFAGLLSWTFMGWERSQVLA